jgi:Asp-tRNA(Asn)/Glu-tRNA(Gln) amidotransferase A subunit family amidase
MGAAQAAAEIAAGRLTSEALARDCLERIAEREPAVLAWQHLDRDAAIRAARELDKQPAQGVLHGVPVGIKDVIDTHDMPTAYGSPIYAGHRPTADAGCVAMARASGMLVLGKTVTTEFASSFPGKTRNPHNPAHTPGGSSSGSAAGVADYMLPLAVGTQTGGSVIRPASFCGVVGFKPSYGLINRCGVKQLSDTLDTVGVFGREVADVALLVAALTGRGDFIGVAESPPPRVGVCRTPDWAQAQPETVAALEHACRLLNAAGAKLSDCTLPAPFNALGDVHGKVEYFEMARALQHEYRLHREQLSAGLASRVQNGLACSADAYEAAARHARECRVLMDGVFDDFDVLLAPSAPGEAPPGLTSTGKAIFNRMWTLLGVPCVTLPCTRGPTGLPVGVQIIGRYRADRKTLDVAAWIERRLAV